MNTPDDPIVRRAVDELRRLPEVDDAALRRVVQAAAAARLAPADEAPPVVASRPRSFRVLTGIGIAAAAAIVGFVARGQWSANPTSQPQAAMQPIAASPLRADTMARFAASKSTDVVALPQQFVLENSRAHRVSVVGDFNNWNASAAPMSRAKDGGLWSTIIPVMPGRHIYGFMVDDSIFVIDPRAQSTRDPDFGTESSVLMVGRP